MKDISMQKAKRVAIVHDWLVTDAGAEKVLHELLVLYPDADVFTLVDFLSPEDRENILNDRKTKTSFIQYLPYARKYFRYYLPLMPLAIGLLNVRGHDLIISSSWAFAKGVKPHKDALHVCYCHTPIRYAWDMYETYTKDLPFLKKCITKLILKLIRKWDIASLDRVDYFVSNSNFVSERIKRTYERDSIVVYPPVNTDAFQIGNQKKPFYLTASRLVGYKKTKLIIEAFNKLNLPLIVIGDGEELASLKTIAGSNVTLLGHQPQEVLIKYMQEARAFIYAALEDFGIVPVEAMACGTPVVALSQGGTLESVIDGESGVLFANQTIEDIMIAIKMVESKNLVFDPLHVRDCALKFSVENFRKNFVKAMEMIERDHSVAP